MVRSFAARAALHPYASWRHWDRGDDQLRDEGTWSTGLALKRSTGIARARYRLKRMPFACARKPTPTVSSPWSPIAPRRLRRKATSRYQPYVERRFENLKTEYAVARLTQNPSSCDWAPPCPLPRSHGRCTQGAREPSCHGEVGLEELPEGAALQGADNLTHHGLLRSGGMVPPYRERRLNCHSCSFVEYLETTL